MAKSTNYNLELPAQTDFYDVDVTNANFTTVDTELKKVSDKATSSVDKIGDLNTLQTVEKRHLVGAINEVKDGLGNVSSDATDTSYTDTTTQLGATNVQQAIEKIVEKVNTTNTNLNDLENKIKENRTVVSSTLTASKWQGNTYSFETEYPHAQYDIAIELGENATLEQAYAFADACLKGSIGTQVITALDIVPTIDIPITIEVLKKWE